MNHYHARAFTLIRCILYFLSRSLTWASLNWVAHCKSRAKKKYKGLYTIYIATRLDLAILSFRDKILRGFGSEFEGKRKGRFARARARASDATQRDRPRCLLNSTLYSSPCTLDLHVTSFHQDTSSRIFNFETLFMYFYPARYIIISIHTYLPAYCHSKLLMFIDHFYQSRLRAKRDANFVSGLSRRRRLSYFFVYT